MNLVVLLQIVYLVMNIRLYNMKMFMLSLFFKLINSISFISYFIDGCVASTFCKLMTYYEYLRINNINNHVESAYKSIGKDTSKVYRAVKAFTEDHRRAQLVC